MRSDAPSHEYWRVLEPASLAEFDDDLGVPYEGYADALRDAFDTGRRSWEERRSAPYRVRRPVEPPSDAPPSFGPLARLLLLDCDVAGAYVQHTARLTEVLREAVMQRVADPLPPALSGHGADDGQHVGFLALPNVGSPDRLPEASYEERIRASNEHADGRVLTLALSIPTDLEASDIRQILVAFDDAWLRACRLDCARRRPGASRSGAAGRG